MNIFACVFATYWLLFVSSNKYHETRKTWKTEETDETEKTEKTKRKQNTNIKYKIIN